MIQINGVILDVDGTLIDSNDAHAHAWVQALREHGFPVPFQQVRKLIGMGGDNLLQETAHIEKESAAGKAMAARYLEIFKADYLPNLKPFSGARDLVEHIQQQGLKVVVGSSSESDVLQTLLKIAEVDDLLTETVSSKDTQNSKPDPDIIHVALERLRLPPDQVLMLGDTPYDIEAAAKANVKTIAFRCGGWPNVDLIGAIAIYDDPADLHAHLDQSPLVRRERAAQGT